MEPKLEGVAPVHVGAWTAPLILIGLTPALMALATWDPQGTRNILEHWMRLWGLPALLVELVVILWRVFAGWNPLRLLRHLTGPVGIAFATILIINTGNMFLVAHDFARAAAGTFYLLVHLFFGLAVAEFLRAQKDIQFLWEAVVIGQVGYFLILVAFVCAIPDAAHFEWLYLGLGVQNIRHAAFFAAIGAAGALGLAAAAQTRRDYFTWAGVAALMFALSFWSGTRGSILGVWIGLGCTLLLVPKLSRTRLIMTIAGSTLAGLLLSTIHSVPHRLYGAGRLVASAHLETMNAVSSGRMELWSGTWRAILQRPLFGYGQDQLIVVVRQAQSLFPHPHNAILQSLFQWGLIGTISVFIVALWVARRCWLNLRRSGLVLAPACTVAITLLAMSMHDGTLYFNYPLMIMALCLASMTALSNENRAQTPA